MRRFNLFLLASLGVAVSACGGSSSSDGDDDGGSGDIRFIDWRGSANDEFVVDATDDLFRFRADNRKLYFGSTTISNVKVNNSGNLIIDGNNVGCVCAIKAVNGDTITGLISNSGFYIDFFGPERNLTWQISAKAPVFARPADESDTEGNVQYRHREQESVPNAIIENLPYENESLAIPE